MGSHPTRKLGRQKEGSKEGRKEGRNQVTAIPLVYGPLRLPSCRKLVSSSLGSGGNRRKSSESGLEDWKRREEGHLKALTCLEQRHVSSDLLGHDRKAFAFTFVGRSEHTEPDTPIAHFVQVFQRGVSFKCVSDCSYICLCL